MNSPGSTVPALALAATALVAAASPAVGLWAGEPVDVPVERLLRNTETYIEEHPGDPQGHYLLGRLHSMAFALGDGEVAIVSLPGSTGIGSPPRLWPVSVRVRPRYPADGPTAAQLVHLAASIASYRQAVRLGDGDDPAFESSRARLGLAWMLEKAWRNAEAFRALASRRGLEDLPEEQRLQVEELLGGSSGWRDEALGLYRRVYELESAGDRERGHRGPGPDSLLSLDAARAIVRILRRGPVGPSEREEIARLEEQIDRLQLLPRPVTPIVFALDRPRPLARLLSPERLARFDLDGDGIPRRWPWVRRHTLFLVWDPLGSGVVADGRQLFGSVTWWIFWDHGYQPLAALDNDGDGWLRGDELAGLAAWRDGNGNGRADRGEVAPIVNHGVRGIATRPGRGSDGTLMIGHGIELADGRRLPTYDWTALPADGPSGDGGPESARE